MDSAERTAHMGAFEDMTPDRHDQILNHIAEEWVDLKQTDFATKAELCEVILRLMEELDDLRLCRPPEPFIGPKTLLDTLFEGDFQKMEKTFFEKMRMTKPHCVLLDKSPLPDGAGFNHKSIK